jgi:hypothetical protein
MTDVQVAKNSLVSRILALFHQEHVKYPAVSSKLGRPELRLHAPLNAMVVSPQDVPRKASMHVTIVI